MISIDVIQPKKDLSMKLRIENLGIVKQAEIDLDKSLTLFCGNNSTGKTMYHMYCMHF